MPLEAPGAEAMMVVEPGHFDEILANTCHSILEKEMNDASSKISVSIWPGGGRVALDEKTLIDDPFLNLIFPMSARVICSTNWVAWSINLLA
jgi:hypothetical protein